MVSPRGGAYVNLSLIGRPVYSQNKYAFLVKLQLPEALVGEPAVLADFYLGDRVAVGYPEKLGVVIDPKLRKGPAQETLYPPAHPPVDGFGCEHDVEGHKAYRKDQQIARRLLPSPPEEGQNQGCYDGRYSSAPKEYQNPDDFPPCGMGNDVLTLARREPRPGKGRLGLKRSHVPGETGHLKGYRTYPHDYQGYGNRQN